MLLLVRRRYETTRRLQDVNLDCHIVIVFLEVFRSHDVSRPVCLMATIQYIESYLIHCPAPHAHMYRGRLFANNAIYWRGIVAGMQRNMYCRYTQTKTVSSRIRSAQQDARASKMLRDCCVRIEQLVRRSYM